MTVETTPRTEPSFEVTASVSKIETWHAVFPLTPFRLGAKVVSQRDFTVVRVELSDGTVGASFGQCRKAPVDMVITELLAPMILGTQAESPASVRRRCLAGLGQHEPIGLVGRGLSLLDLALWDALGHSTGTPVWKLLGGAGHSAPGMLVAGYFIDGESDEGFADRVAGKAAEGWKALKLAGMPQDPDRFTRRLELLRNLVDEDVEIVVDMVAAFDDPVLLLEQARGWKDLGLAWIEDPLAASETEKISWLRHELDIPLGIGDEVTSRQALEYLAQRNAIDVLRVDLLAGGGLTCLPELQGLAQRHGLRISTHAYPHFHRHAVQGAEGMGLIETFGPGSAWDASPQFVGGVGHRFDNAQDRIVVDAPNEPGLGLDIDWRAVESHTRRHSAVSSEGKVPAP